MRLTQKKYWEDSWHGLKLPAGFTKEQCHKVIGDKVLQEIKAAKLKPEKIIEIGGCPGRWADFFNQNFSCRCDSLDYGKNSCQITEKNYQLLQIEGKVFNQDIFKHNLKKHSYDIVLSDGLVEHFTELEPIFKKHLELLKDKGILIIAVPNIKQSSLYNPLAKKDKGYDGYRAISIKELTKMARKNHLKILYNNYLGVFNLGLINWSFIRNRFMRKLVAYFIQFINLILLILQFKHETPTFSPYIYLIAQKKS